MKPKLYIGKKGLGMTSFDIKEFENHNNWLKNIANNCEHIKEPEFISIPTFIPKCTLTNDACTYENCPKIKKKQCSWKCPMCDKQCGGFENHKGEHQCPIHYKSHTVK